MEEKAKKYLAQDERRQQLLETGLTLFGNRSYDEISIDDIAEAAGVSKGLIYHYFRGKRAFYCDVVEFAASGLLESLQPDEELDGPENLRRGLHAYFQFVEERADAYLALMHGGLGVDGLVAKILAEARDSVTETILEGLDTEPTPTVRLTIRSWIGGVEAAALDWLAHRDVEREEVVRLATAALVGALSVTMDRRSLLKHVDRSMLKLVLWRDG